MGATRIAPEAGGEGVPAGEALTKWDIFHYVYGMLHHPAYRERFADCLKKELPRIPLPRDAETFAAFRDAGRELGRLHAEYETVDRYPLEWLTHPDRPVDYRVGEQKMKLKPGRGSFTAKGRVKVAKAPGELCLEVNETLVLNGIPESVQDYRLGNRSALEWVVDQYRIKTDKRSGITQDPNDPEHPQAIVELVERVVTVSLRTNEIIAKLPEAW